MALEHEALTERIIRAVIEVHRRLGTGLLESVYEKALIIELKKRGLTLRDQMEVIKKSSESSLLETVPAFLPSSFSLAQPQTTVLIKLNEEPTKAGETDMALEHEALTERIIGAAIEVHRRLGPGFLESVYEKALSTTFASAHL